jgi:hypothetical protein
MTARFGFWLKGPTEIVIRHHGGITMLPIVPRPEPGSTSEGFRLVSSDYQDSTYILNLEGRSGMKETFGLWTANGDEPEVANARIISKEGNIFMVEVRFKQEETKFVTETVRFKVSGRQ